MNAIINYVLKILLNFVVVLIVVGISLTLCSTVATESEIEVAIELDRFTEKIIEEMPRVGKLTSYVFSLFGIQTKQNVPSDVSILSEITYIMLLSTIYQIMFSLSQGIKKFIDDRLRTIKALEMINDLFPFCMIALTSTISATLIAFFLKKTIGQYGYGSWATLITCVVVILVVCVVKYRGNLQFQKIAFEILIAVVNALAMFIICALVGFMNLLQYATTGEMAIITISLVFSILIATFCFAHAVSTISSK